ncbi:MAG: hypothetical protein SGBAC_013097 [Bacillariaceae sp.]
MADRIKEDAASTENVEESAENDPWANDGSILPDLGCRYQLISQPPPDNCNSDEDDGDANTEVCHADSLPSMESTGISLDLADSLLRGLEEDYKATHARAFSSPSPASASDTIQEASIPVGEASLTIHDDEQKDNSFAGNESSAETNEDLSFPVHWNDSKPDAEVDLATVRKSVQHISDDETSNFIQKYSAWQQRQRQQCDSQHPIIPSAPLQAFHRETDKAKRATASLSRSATIAEALWRCQQQMNRFHNNSSTICTKEEEDNHKSTILIVDVVGVDHVECASIGRIQDTFKPIVRWLGASQDLLLETNTTIQLRLIGRDLSKSVSAEPIDLLTTSVNSKKNGIINSVIKATAMCFSEICYHDWRASIPQDPDLIIAFNAGIWGYVEWAPTLRALGQGSIATPTVITSYTLEEAQEDFESIEEAVAGTAAKVVWGPEPNQFGSKVVRETKSSSREYRENSAWQMWLLGGGDGTKE